MIKGNYPLVEGKGEKADWQPIGIPCPRCGVEVHRVHRKAVSWAMLEGVKHEACGFVGDIEWTNPEMERGGRIIEFKNGQLVPGTLGNDFRIAD